MHRTLAVIAAATLAAPASAQSCDAPVGPTESCMIGTWIGSSSIPDAMEAMLLAMPDTISAAFQDLGRPVAIQIYEDGFYATFPMSVEGVSLQQITEDANAELDMVAQTTTTTGYLSAVGGTVEMCSTPGTGQLSGQMTVTTPDGSSTAPLFAPPGRVGPMPPMSYSCSGDSMQMIVALPEPIGAITYDMTRIPASRLSAEFRARVEDRFAPAD